MRAAKPKLPPLPKAIRVLFAVRLIGSAGNFVYPFLTMLLTMKMGWEPAKAGAFMTAMSLLGGIGMLVGGKLGDAVGRKRSILSAQLGASVIFFACFAVGMVPALPYLIAVANILLSSTWPVSNAMVADIAKPEERKRAYSLLYWGNNIGFSVGPLMAGFLFSRAPSLMFLGNAAALLVGVFLVGFLVRETLPRAGGPRPAEDAAPRDGPSSAASAAAPEGAAAPEAELAVSGGALGVLRRRPILLGFALATAVMNFVYAQHQFSLPVFLGDRLGEGGPQLFGAAMTTNGLTVVAATALVTFLLGRLESLACMALAALLYAAGFGLLSFASGPNAVFVVLSSTVVWTLGEIVAATNVNVFIASHSPLSHRSRISSIVTWMSSMGFMLCPAITGAFIAARGSAAVWPLAACVALVGALLMVLLGLADRPRQRANTQN
jgi:MFS family permease